MRASALLMLGMACASTLVAQPSKVLFIGIDGLSSNGLRTANTPVIDSLCKAGTVCFNVQAVLPTSSSPNWASMMMGAGPDLHKITSNNWQRAGVHGRLNCYGQTKRGRRVASWPTFFGVLRQQRPSATIAVFNDWRDYNRMIEPKVLNHHWEPSRKQGKMEVSHFATTDRAIAHLRSHSPDLMFVHLDHVDHAGHSIGHGTPGYFRAVEVADSLIGQMLTALKQAGQAANTVVFISADHGGIGNGHGGNTPEERTIPLVISGPGIKPGQVLDGPFNTFDTAPTVLKVLQLTAPECWVGQPILQAFIQP